MNVITHHDLDLAIQKLKSHPNTLKEVTIELGLATWGCFLTKNNGEKDTLFESTYPPMWLAEYLEFQYYKIDPVVLEARHSFHPYIWNKERYPDTESNRVFFHRAARFGISEGITFPIHHHTSKEHDYIYGIFTFSTHKPPHELNKLLADHREKLIELVNIFVEAILQSPNWLKESDYNVMIAQTDT